MNMDWDGDGIAFSVDFWRVAIRTLKPGGYLAAFGSPKTSHRLASAIEDAGFEIRDTLQWLFGEGSPAKCRTLGTAGRPDLGMHLKPAHEPIVLARRPLAEPTLAANIAAFGTGALNVDGCRIKVLPDDGSARGPSNATTDPDRKFDEAPSAPDYRNEQHPLGRWPANVVASCCAPEAPEPCPGCPAAELDRQSGLLKSGANPTRRLSDRHGNVFAPYGGNAKCVAHRGPDTGGASRFFYVAKASQAEREEGLWNFEEGPQNWSSGTQNPGSFQSTGSRRASKNPHPTVKPVGIMRWLIRLTVGPGAVILDPFGGSGTTAVAATLEGVRSVLAEREEEYLPVIRARAEHAARKGPRPGEKLGVAPRRPKPPARDLQQLAFALGEDEAGTGVPG